MTGVGGPFHDRGRQCHVAAVRGVFLGHDADGEEIYLAALDGSRVDPTSLVGVDPRTGEVRHQATIDELTGPKTVTQTPGGSVFVGGYHPGALYRWRLDGGEVENLGKPFEGVEFIWSLVADSRGAVYGGTWPVGGAFRWHPDDGFSTIGPFPVAPMAEYVRCVAVDETQELAVIGYGTPGGCLVVDLRTGEELRPFAELFARDPFVYSASISDGLVAVSTETDGAVFRLHRSPDGLRAEHLFTVPGCGPVPLTIIDQQQALIAFATTDREVILMDARGQQAISNDLPDRGVRSLDLSHDHQSLHYLTSSGTGKIDLASGAVHRADVTGLPVAAQAISALACGPDGRIYAGGFLNGGICVTDVDSGAREQLGPIGQPEVLASWGDALVVGAYPSGWVHVIDRSALIDGSALTAADFRPQTSISYQSQHQDRAYGFAALDANKAYVGFMAGYGRLPGGVVELERGADDQVIGAEPWMMVGDRSVISLAVISGPTGPILFGATMVDGGMGIAPTEARAVLFRRDLSTGEVRLLDPPVERCRALYALTERSGRLWMFAEHELINFDPLTDEWKTSDLDLSIPRFNDGRLHAHDATMRLHPDGRLYATVRGRGLIVVDPDAASCELLWEGEARHLAIDHRGHVHFADSQTLSMLSCPPRRAP